MRGSAQCYALAMRHGSYHLVLPLTRNLLFAKVAYSEVLELLSDFTERLSSTPRILHLEANHRRKGQSHIYLHVWLCP